MKDTSFSWNRKARKRKGKDCFFRVCDFLSVCLLLDAKNRFRLIVRAEEEKDSIQIHGKGGIGKKRRSRDSVCFWPLISRGWLWCWFATNEQTNRETDGDRYNLLLSLEGCETESQEQVGPVQLGLG